MLLSDIETCIKRHDDGHTVRIYYVVDRMETENTKNRRMDGPRLSCLHGRVDGPKLSCLHGTHETRYDDAAPCCSVKNFSFATCILFYEERYIVLLKVVPFQCLGNKTLSFQSIDKRLKHCMFAEFRRQANFWM